MTIQNTQLLFFRFAWIRRIKLGAWNQFDLKRWHFNGASSREHANAFNSVCTYSLCQTSNWGKKWVQKQFCDGYHSSYYDNTVVVYFGPFRQTVCFGSEQARGSGEGRNCSLKKNNILHTFCSFSNTWSYKNVDPFNN